MNSQQFEPEVIEIPHNKPNSSSNTPEQLRQLSVRGIDKLLDNWFAKRSLSTEEIRLAKAQRTFWMNASPEIMNQLLQNYNSEPVRQEDIEPQEEMVEDGSRAFSGRELKALEELKKSEMGI